MEYRVAYYDSGNCWIDTKEFIVDSIEELKKKSRDYAEVLVDEGWDIAGWNYSDIKEDF